MSRLLALLLAIILAQVLPASTQDNPCNDPRIWLPATDPAQTEAMKLSEMLSENGIQVRCVLRSKEAQMFDGQLGAAFFSTDIGDFDALFLPHPVPGTS